MSQEFKDLPEASLNLSPEKYGKAAYAHLTYTPSRLKENLLYIEATTMKKDEEKNSKLREITAENDLLQDKVDQLKREKEGIEESLNQQILMYKKFISEMESKYEIKIKDIQSQFKVEMRIVIEENEEKAKLVQAERERYEQEIEELRYQNQDLSGKLNEAKKILKELNVEREKLHLSQKEITFELEEVKELKKNDANKKQQEFDQLKQKLFETQENHKAEIHATIMEKEREQDNLKRQSLHDLGKLEEKLFSETELKNSEIQQITKTFNFEVERLNSLLKERENAIQVLSIELNDQKEKTLEMTRVYDKEINGLIYQKNRAAGELDVVKVHNLELIEREKIGASRSMFNIEADKLRELLLESYNELEKCKEELLWMDKERSRLLSQISYSPYSKQF